MEKESEKRSVLVFLVVRKSVLKVRRKAEMIRIVATTSVNFPTHQQGNGIGNRRIDESERAPTGGPDR